MERNYLELFKDLSNEKLNSQLIEALYKDLVEYLILCEFSQKLKSNKEKLELSKKVIFLKSKIDSKCELIEKTKNKTKH